MWLTPTSFPTLLPRHSISFHPQGEKSPSSNFLRNYLNETSKQAAKPSELYNSVHAKTESPKTPRPKNKKKNVSDKAQNRVHAEKERMEIKY